MLKKSRDKLLVKAGGGLSEISLIHIFSDTLEKELCFKYILDGRKTGS